MRKYVLVISSIVFIFVSIIAVISKTLVPMVQNSEYEKMVSERNERYKQEQKEKEENKEEVPPVVSTVPESDGQRVGMYIGEYIGYINAKDYDKAYALLNEGFKNLNFPIIEKYKEYVDKTYVRTKVVEYVKFKLEGYVYVVDTKIHDLAIYDNPVSFDQVFMFQETEPGVFNLSFGI